MKMGTFSKVPGVNTTKIQRDRRWRRQEDHVRPQSSLAGHGSACGLWVTRQPSLGKDTTFT